jgi:hypothetical protein
MKKLFKVSKEESDITSLRDGHRALGLEEIILGRTT